jgi:carbon monoxide dehydrogenase subunit G
VEFETEVRIDRPVQEVFDYVSDPRNFAQWNSAVQAVRSTGGEGEPGSTYLMERDLPGGGAENGLEVVDRVPTSEFTIRTTSGPTPFVYRYRFKSAGEGTLLHLSASVELGGLAGALGPLASRGVKRGVDSNFADLKGILERG